jgi:hypothetical protein
VAIEYRSPHVATENVFGLLHLLAAAHASRARSPHLGELRHVGVAENEAVVRMCNQAAIRIDHIGLSVFTDLDLGHHVPDQLETDLGDADAGVEPGAGDR